MSTSDTESTLLLQAYVDGELDAASALAFDRRLQQDPELAAARDELLGLRRLLRGNIPRETASERLLAAMAAHAGREAERPARVEPRLALFGRVRRPVRSDWGTALAACLVGALAGATLTAGALKPNSQAPAMAEVVSDHLRAVMAPQPFDVASSDQHTVKPWFTGRLPFAPHVFDLAKDGFPLVGGRVDVVAGQPAATLVFRHDKHLISLTSQPVGATLGANQAGEEHRGFQVRDWVDGGMHYWAVSDVAAAELDAFESAARAQLAGAG